jgi:hypothetical protein
MADQSTKLNELIRVPDQEALQMIRVLATSDRRDMGDEVAELIHQEYGRRFSQPSMSLVEQALETVGAPK